MKRAASWLGCVLLVGPGLAVALSDEGSNPYAVISERNVFHLNPIPPPPEPEKPKLDLPKIKLSGFFKVGSQTRALFSSEPKKKDEGPVYYNLAEGEKEGILEVVKIDAENGKVDVINTGTPVTLTLKDDSLAASPAAAGEKPQANGGPPGPFAGRVPAMPRMPGRQPMQPGGAAPTPAGFPGANVANLPNPMRPRRVPVPQ